MSHNKRILLILLALGLSGEAAAFGQDTLPATPRSLGKVLVMDSERCLEGDIEVVDDQYCVRQGTSEVWITGKKVLRVCPDWTAAYQFVKQRANLDDPDERLRIARWCQRHGMLQEALVEAKIAQDMRPVHTETQHLVLVLKGNLSISKTVATPVARTVEAVDSLPAPDLIPEAVAHFATKIQPILLNTCINCHSGGKGGEFQLYRTSDGGQRVALQRNLKMVVNQIRFDNPELSPLLFKAISPHGTTSAVPLPGKKSVPYQTLEGWVRGVVKLHPHLREQGIGKRAAEERTGPMTVSGPKASFGEADRPASASHEPTSPVVPGPALPGPAVSVAVPAKAPPAKNDAAGRKEAAVPAPALPGGTVVSATNMDPSSAAPATKKEPEEPDAYSATEFNRLVQPSR